LGLDALHKGTVPKAFEELYISDKIKPNQPETLDAIAYAWRLRGNNKNAEKFYKKAIREGAGAATYNNYGSLLIELGNYDKAIQQFNKALEDPTYRNQSLVFVNMGDAYVGLNNLEEAVKSYRKARLLSPNWTYPQLKEANAYQAFHRPNYAQALYETILRQEPANQEALASLISLLKGKGQDSLLRTYIQAFIKATPDKLQQAWAKDELALLGK
jgi:Tfp pilus assembly protein PilF